ncbi:MAG TPA: DUF4864 domain-containing protein [Candidatus Obscuribacterales bacterium]
MIDITERDRLAIKTTISQQLQAFEQGNAMQAFSFASPSIQLQFQTPDRFMHMVRRAYPPVYQARSVIFEDVGMIDHHLAQSVLMMGQDGTLSRALYLMQQQLDHSWRINGCLLLPIHDPESVE